MGSLMHNGYQAYCCTGWMTWCTSQPNERHGDAGWLMGYGNSVDSKSAAPVELCERYSITLSIYVLA